MFKGLKKREKRIRNKRNWHVGASLTAGVGVGGVDPPDPELS